jgi:hypothetical protein
MQSKNTQLDEAEPKMLKILEKTETLKPKWNL